MRRSTPLLFALLVAGVLAAPAHALKFIKCSKTGFQCAKLSVPLDYDSPNGRVTSLDVGRYPATDRKHRIGSLFVNYGGPGGDAVDTTKRAGSFFFAALNKRYDIVAIDPRGTGRRPLAIDCKANQERIGVYNLPFAAKEGRKAAQKLARAKAYASRCEERNAAIGDHVSTANVARDMNRLRVALGEDKVSYFGYSYGTFVGATFLSLYGDHVRAAVLDGALDPDGYINHPAENLTEQTAGFEDALDRFEAACARERDTCTWTGRGNPAKVYDALIAKADRKPIRVRDAKLTKGDTRPVTGEEINFAMAGDLYAKQAWGEIAEALNSAARGDASLFRALTDFSYGLKPNGGYDPGLDRYFAIGAAEQAYPTDPQPFLDAFSSNAMLFPHMLWNNKDAELPYTQYSLRDEDAFTGPFVQPDGSATALVIGNTHDPATPIAGARALTEQLGDAQLLVMDGDGHTAYPGNSKCIDAAVERYLLAGKLPPKALKCRQRVPFPLPPEPDASASSAGSTRLDPTSVGLAGPDTPLSAPFTR